jgi:hypothetical protein
MIREDDDDEARRDSERIAALLDDVHALASGPVSQRIEELVQRLVHLYGRGLGRLMGLLEQGGLLDGALAQRLDADPLLSSLLALHGLHPLPASTRAQRAADEVFRQFGIPPVPLTLDERGAVLRVPPHRTETLAPALERAIIEAAPELGGVRIEVPPEVQSLIQIDLGRSRQGAP